MHTPHRTALGMAAAVTLALGLAPTLSSAASPESSGSSGAAGAAGLSWKRVDLPSPSRACAASTRSTPGPPG